MTDSIDQHLATALAELSAAKTAPDLEAWRIKFISSKATKDLMAPLASAPKDQKRQIGQKLNAVKDQLNSGFESAKASLAQAQGGKDALDVTEPGRRPLIGNRHILMKVIDELTDLFGKMGFSVASGPEVEDEFHNFIALNIPESHPARDPLDNFYLSTAAGQQGGQGRQRLLRTQTSTVQIRVMEHQKPPIRVVIPGRVYRPDTHDATHLSMFHQLEALAVDRNLTMVDLKSTIDQFIRAYFGPQTRFRLRPSFFPFTEPSAEVDVWFEDKQRWIELGGCGMVHPNVFKAVNIDPREYSGWAFGFGIERIAMRKYGIGDIRLFVENDVRFLRQF
ncbi:MAG TPA: phenylalanine--tRNA ligase subunit alpha [Tepidisphaeraceae bacterium]|nr:phenylalanine--tRNA ligase subunit alpha [Tepidisphaeraceae bacterium]